MSTEPNVGIIYVLIQFLVLTCRLRNLYFFYNNIYIITCFIQINGETEMVFGFQKTATAVKKPGWLDRWMDGWMDR